MGIFECIPEKSMHEVIMHPQVCIATDGISVEGHSGSFHERCVDSSFRFLKIWANEGRPLGNGLIKLTSLPARVMGLSNRGVIREGNFADLVLFNDDTLEGVASVFVNGELSYSEQSVTGLNGKVLRSNE